MRRLLVGGIALVLAACASAPESGDSADTSEAATAPANASASHILFPGDPACGGPCEAFLANNDLFIPPTNGNPWGNTYALGSTTADSAAGYSSGRIALLRRLALAPTAQRVGVLLDPSWADGTRAFTTTPSTGPDLVTAWLDGDPDRKFVLIYSTLSTGWKEYAALQSGPNGARVRVCHVSVQHLDVPRTVGRDALTAPETWDNGTCSWGVAPADDSNDAP
jgi:hypothetical protein